jgi:hypothetical protein
MSEVQCPLCYRFSTDKRNIVAGCILCGDAMKVPAEVRAAFILKFESWSTITIHAVFDFLDEMGWHPMYYF